MHRLLSTFTTTCLSADHSDNQDLYIYEVTSTSPGNYPARVSPRLACEVEIRDSREGHWKAGKGQSGQERLIVKHARFSERAAASPTNIINCDGYLRHS